MKGEKRCKRIKENKKQRRNNKTPETKQNPKLPDLCTGSFNLSRSVSEEERPEYVQHSHHRPCQYLAFLQPHAKKVEATHRKPPEWCALQLEVAAIRKHRIGQGSSSPAHNWRPRSKRIYLLFSLASSTDVDAKGAQHTCLPIP